MTSPTGSSFSDDYALFFDEEFAKLALLAGTTCGNVAVGPGTEYAVIGQLNADECGLRRLGPNEIGGGAAWAPIQRWDSTGATGAPGLVLADHLRPGSAPAPTSVASNLVSVRFELNFGNLPGPYPSLNSYDVRIGAAEIPNGQLDATGSYDFDASTLPVQVRLRAPFPNDPFCWWTGSATVNGAGVTAIEVVALCA